MKKKPVKRDDQGSCYSALETGTRLTVIEIATVEPPHIILYYIILNKKMDKYVLPAQKITHAWLCSGKK